MKIAFAKPSVPSEGAVAVGVLADRTLTPAAAEIDEATGGAVRRALEAAGRFKGERESGFVIPAPAGVSASAVVLYGLGKAEDLDAVKLRRIGGDLAARLLALDLPSAGVRVDPLEGAPVEPAEMAAEMAFGLRLRAYRFDKYRTEKKDESKPKLKTATLLVAGHTDAKKRFQSRDKVADGVFLARDLVTEPPNEKRPEDYAKRLEKHLTALGVEVEVLDEKKLRKLGMHSLLSVAQGSTHEARVVVMRWNGTGSETPSAALIGKGVTFDTGGLSLKPPQAMMQMKIDMGGSAAVAGTVAALAGRKAAVDVVGLVGLVENMPSGQSTRPGDVVGSLSGKTIEVLNTDAEGRLVLADLLWYAEDRFKPKAMVDIATLTGAVLVSLGTQRAGLFASDDDLAARLTAASEGEDEMLWRLPLGPEFDKALESEIADMRNIGRNAHGGSCIAAQFLRRFVREVPWAHLDIAGTVWSDSDGPLAPKGAAGFAVRTLHRYVTDSFES